jgi:hypothetical protein
LFAHGRLSATNGLKPEVTLKLSADVSLPNYFLADLPPGTPLPPELVVEACQTLRRNRARYLQPRPTESLVQTVAEVARQWLAPHSPWRAHALDHGPDTTGFSRQMLEQGLTTYFRLLTARNLNALILQEFGHPHRLDRLISNDAETMSGTAANARGPELLVHIMAGSLPTPVFTAMIHGFLVGSAQVVKCASGASHLPRLFAHSIREVEPKLASCLELVEWKGGTHPAEPSLFAEADCVVASGSDETLEALRRVVPGRARFLGYGHRVSAAYITREMLGPDEEQRAVEAAAADVAAWDQLGCLSPHVIYVETGGLQPPEGFARLLAQELARLEQSLPRGRVDADTAALIFQRREAYQVRAAAEIGTLCWFSPESTAWTVVFEQDARFQLSCLHRFVYVKPVDTLEECLRQAEPIRGKWSTVGLAANATRRPELAQQFADWGITRICPLGRMQRPPLSWRHDGRPVLGDLVTWTSHEFPPEE